MARRQSVIMTTNETDAMRDALEKQVKEYRAAVDQAEKALDMKRRILERLENELKTLGSPMAK